MKGRGVLKTKTKDLNIHHAKWVRLQVFDDGVDGLLTIAEKSKQIPFEIRRVYFICRLGHRKTIRGKHAHKRLRQVLFAIKGSVNVTLDDGIRKRTVRLHEPQVGIYLGPRVWHTMTKFSRDCILLVFSSDIYRESDYIRQYRSFLQFTRKRA